MRAVIQDSYGGPEVLRLGEAPTPTLGKEQVLLAVEAAAVDRGTVHLLHGTPYLVRLGLGLRRPRRRFRVPGRDVAGTVVAVGPGVDDLRPGDRVHGTADGALAERAIAPARRLAPWPAGLSATEAAAVPISGLTALQALRAARVSPGDRVLVLGASGGVGTWLVQLAAAQGLHVTASTSAAKADLVASLGAAQVLDHDAALVPPAEPYAAVLAVGGNHRLRTQRALLRRGGTLVQVGRDDPGRWTAGYLRSAGAAMVSPLLRHHRVVLLVAAESGADLATLAPLLEDGRVRPVVDRTWPLDDVAAALEHLAAGRARGKVAIEVAIEVASEVASVDAGEDAP